MVVRRREKKLKFPTREGCTNQNSKIHAKLKKKKLGVEFTLNETNLKMS